jgi:hypothetical protein
MSSPADGDLPVLDSDATASPCRHLRHKGMFVYTDGCGGETHDGYDNTVYWCLKTMKGYGPDDDLVGSEECCTPSRSCYEPT